MPRIVIRSLTFPFKNKLILPNLDQLLSWLTCGFDISHVYGARGYMAGVCKIHTFFPYKVMIWWVCFFFFCLKATYFFLPGAFLTSQVELTNEENPLGPGHSAPHVQASLPGPQRVWLQPRALGGPGSWGRRGAPLCSDKEGRQQELGGVWRLLTVSSPPQHRCFSGCLSSWRACAGQGLRLSGDEPRSCPGAGQDCAVPGGTCSEQVFLPHQL